jgi:hypothetical protein
MVSYWHLLEQDNMQLSSEIELAIKLGEIVCGSKSHESEELRRTIDILGDVRIGIRPTNDGHLSRTLRAVVHHRGDVSFSRFIINCLEILDIPESPFTKWYTMQRLAFFCKGIGYLYPPSSMMWGDVWNNAFCIPGVTNHKEFYDYADDLFRQSEEVKKEIYAKNDKA